MNLLKNKVVWITGGAKGIGASLSRVFLENEAKVVASGSNELDYYIDNEYLNEWVINNPNFSFKKCDVRRINDINNIYNYYIYKKNAKKIHDFLYQKFWFIFENYVESFLLRKDINKRFKKTAIQNLIFDFLKIYNLDENYFDMLKKEFYRYKRNLINQTKTKKSRHESEANSY